MIKRSLLVTSIAVAIMQQASAAPLVPIDARGLAMGSTGVASAKLAHAPQYNPALLSTAHAEDDFAIIFPQIGVIASDEEKLVESFDDLANENYKNTQEPIIDYFDTILTNLDNSLTTGSSSVEQRIQTLKNELDTPTTTAALRSASVDLDNSIANVQLQTADLTQTTFDLTSELDNLSGSPLNGSLGINGAIAIPSKTFSAAISVSGSAYFSGRMFFTQGDQNLLNDYAGGINDYAGEVKEYTAATTLLANTLDAADTECTANPGSALCTSLGTQADDQLDAANEELDDLNNFSRTSDDTVIITTDANGNIVITEDPELTSNVQIVAVGITEIGLTFSREFEISGKKIAFGITPKLQTIKTFNYVASVEDEDIETEDIEDTEQDFSSFNLDAGAAYQFGDTNQWQVGVVAKNLLSKEYDTESNEFGPKDPITDQFISPATTKTTKTTISLDTQFRGGISHTTDWTVVAIDVDLMENDPIAFEEPTQYASIGAELNLFDTLQIRAGYRTNLSVSDASIASFGLGLSPFGVHLDIAAMANPSDPEKEAGVAMELGFYF